MPIQKGSLFTLKYDSGNCFLFADTNNKHSMVSYFCWSLTVHNTCIYTEQRQKLISIKTCFTDLLFTWPETEFCVALCFV